MAVDSYLEMYTMLYGWLFYDIIWDMLSETGILFLPFIGLLITSFMESYSQGPGEQFIESLVKRLEIELSIAFVVITLAGAPILNFKAQEIQFTPQKSLINPLPTTTNAAEVSSSPTTFGKLVFQGRPAHVQVPIWWGLVLQFSAGFNHGVIVGLPTEIDIRDFLNRLQKTVVKDPELKAEIDDFNRDCFLPAKNKYFSEKPANPATYKIINDYGIDDPMWMGSHMYLDIKGYYDTYRAAEPVKPFLYSSLRDNEWSATLGDPIPTYGRPMCNEWWNGILGESEGIKKKMLVDAGEVTKQIGTFEPNLTQVQQGDAVIKNMLESQPAQWSGRGYDFAYGNTASSTEDNAVVENVVKRGLGAIGMANKAIEFATYLNLLLTAAPMVQALLIMGIIAFLPFLLLAFRFRFTVLLAGAILLFTVKTWTLCWFFAWFTDQNLIRALYPDPGMLALLHNWDFSDKRAILNFLTGAMYIAFPLLLTSIMGMAGVGGISMLTQLQESLTKQFSNPKLRRPRQTRGKR